MLRSSAWGRKGEKGEPGAAGAKGDTGPIGPAGPQGVAGPAGSKGDSGASGATGPAGVKGDPGPQGATGAVGPQGPRGDMGAIGPAGPAATTGTLQFIGNVTVSQTLLLALGAGMARRALTLAGVKTTDRLTFAAITPCAAGCEAMNVYATAADQVTVAYNTPALGIGAVISIPIAVYRILP